MEREIVELRKQVAQVQKAATPQGNYDQWNGSQDAVAGLLDLKTSNGHAKPSTSIFKSLEIVHLTLDRVDELFRIFFTFYHPFCPFLNPDKSPDDFFARSQLLFWAILSVGARHYKAEPLYGSLAGPIMRLVWSTLAEVPQDYHVVKALAVLCMWPFPTSSTSTDPTFMLCGNMMQIALQIGLHRPSHAQDFSKFRIELREAELQDRIRTWAVCNIVAQRVATAYGQPALTIYDWTLDSKAFASEPNYVLPPAIGNRLMIEKFIDKVSKTIYTNNEDPVGLVSDQERATYVSFLSKDLQELEYQLRDDTSPITTLYLQAAELHLRLSVFFSPAYLPSYRKDLLKLYQVTSAFLNTCLSLESTASVTLPGTAYTQGLSIIYGTGYIFQMMLAAGFSVLKLNHTFLSQHDLDTEGASELFRRTIWAIRSMSLSENDLAQRLAEVLAQVWKSGRVRAEPNENNIGEREIDDSLQLRVRCRMSLSHVYDSVWRWRNNFGGKGRPLESYLKNPTDPVGKTGENSGTSSAMGNTNSHPIPTNLTIPASSSIVAGVAGMPTGIGMDNGMGIGMGYGDTSANYEVFDPLNWMLDGLVDIPYAFPGLDGMDMMAAGAPGGNGPI